MTGVTSVVGVPSTHLVCYDVAINLTVGHDSRAINCTAGGQSEARDYDPGKSNDCAKDKKVI